MLNKIISQLNFPETDTLLTISVFVLLSIFLFWQQVSIILFNVCSKKIA